MADARSRSAALGASAWTLKPIAQLVSHLPLTISTEMGWFMASNY